MREYGTSILRFLNTMKKENAFIIFRESTAQHFDSGNDEHLKNRPLNVCTPNESKVESF